MADYTVIVDDNDGQIQYGPSRDAWKLSHSNNTYKGTVHNALTSDANLAFSFVGGREVVVRGNFVGDNNASESTAYPVFQVDSQDFLKCSPNPPQNGGQFLCSTSLSSTITNRTLTMFLNPNAAVQQFHIDYIRYGSSPEVAASQNGTVVFVKAPDNTTLGLSFDSDWKYQPRGGTDDITNAMTSKPSAKATHNFVGDSFAWWACCLPTGTSSNAANVTYNIDGGDAISVQIDGNFIQSAQCKDDRLLFQIHHDQIQPGNHTVEVTYGGNDTKMPLTLCGLAAAPSNFNALDSHLRESSHPAPSAASASTSASPTESSASTKSSKGYSGPSNSSNTGPSSSGGSGRATGVIAGVTVFAFLCVLIISLIWWKRKRTRQQRQERRSSTTDSLASFAFHPFIGFLGTEKQVSTVLEPPSPPVMVSTDVSTMPFITDEQDGNSGLQRTDTRSGSSQLESRPPSYRTAGSLLSV